MNEQDRLEQMIAFLTDNADDIRSWPVGKIVFDWSPAGLKWHIGRFGKASRTDRDEQMSVSA